MMYEFWIRVDRETRMMRGCCLYSTLEYAHVIARRHCGVDGAYEIDCEGVTVYVSPAARAIMNGGQYSLFGAG